MKVKRYSAKTAILLRDEKKVAKIIDLINNHFYPITLVAQICEISRYQVGIVLKEKTPQG